MDYSIILDFGDEPVRTVDEKLDILRFDYSWAEAVEAAEAPDPYRYHLFLKEIYQDFSSFSLMRRARLDKALLEKESVTDGQQLLEEDNVPQAIMNEPDLISSLYETKIKKIKKPNTDYKHDRNSEYKHDRNS